MFGGAAGALADLADALAGAFAHLFGGSPGASADLADALAGALADFLDRAARALADVLHRAPGALADAFDGAAGSAADVLHGAPGALADLAHGAAGAGADVAHRRLEAAADVLEDLRVAVEGGEDAVDDDGDVVEPDLEFGLRLDALDLQLDPAEEHVRADVQLEQVEDLGDERDVRLKVLDLQGDLFHLELRDVEMDVRALRGCAAGPVAGSSRSGPPSRRGTRSARDQPCRTRRRSSFPPMFDPGPEG